ncbi:MULTISPECIES: TetR/AcrR family transcriptional regulator [unclassified Mesorhizobium]|uniref:TetR/AcrR family transcriptional regulator n=1 Tax=unclassified Mesorhizobium TaxID=325217 RepID=UPI00112941A6|nr:MULTISPECIES: TetR/AcrR family transcriptional regulator [unclassified Mesorhizobium]TPM99930.1 TetR/AcrR family transcriptional regulator [Mesorhizobium sp. B2-1-3A]BCG87291.1 TetR family transcriptional regulator [Mesorhizobium sp. 113-3-9]
MARPLSEEKRQAILASATELVATLGTGAATAKIAREAGLSEGSLFNYFASKDELLNQLYLEIKTGLGNALLTSYPSQASVRERSRHVWNNFIDWGAKFPMKRKAMRQLSVSERITEQSRRQGNAAFGDINRMIEESLDDGGLKGCSMAFAGGIFEALAETTLEFIARDPRQREHYKEAGFAFFWSGISK